MSVTQEQATWFADAFNKLVGNVDLAILGKSHVIRLVFDTNGASGYVGNINSMRWTVSPGP